MTKKRKKKFNRRKNFVAIPYTGSFSLSTLADETVLKSSLMASFGEDIYIISLDLYLGLRGHTAGQTPLYFGIAHGDLTASEILEGLSAEQTDPDDIIAREHARRPIRKIGGFQGVVANPVFNHGQKIRQKVGFSVGDTKALDIWVKNQSGAALSSGTLVEFDGVIYGRWQR